MKIYIKILLLVFTLGIVSCDDFLTQEPKHSLTMDNSVKNYEGAKNIVNGVYGVYERATYCGGYLYGYLHCMAGFWDYDYTMYAMGYTQTSDEYTVGQVWSQLYGCINAANAAIEGVSRLPDSEYPSVEVKNALLAEARCFRGFCNLQLLWMFGHWFDTAESPYGIIYRNQSSELSNLMLKRSTVGQSYQYILDDLTFGEEFLEDYKSARKMSKEFAKAMHAKLLLVRGWDNDYKEALGIVNELLTKSSSAFKMENDITQLYEKGWDSNEVLFSRYLGDMPNIANFEIMYAFELYYGDSFSYIVQEWLDNDERYEYTFGTARAPEAWDYSTRDDMLTKLYHRGGFDGLNDMYATYVFRYAELYLMKAELLARTNPGNIEAALAPLNEMRAKYTTPVMAPVTNIKTHEELMDAIYKELVVTLFMENESPWFASLRFEKDGKPWIYTLKPDVSFNKNHYCWPIPDAEIKAHDTPIEQNPDLI